MQKSKVKKVESLGKKEEKVYDIGLKENPHMFFANGILLHNSIMLSTKPLLKKIYSDKWKNDPLKYSRKVCQKVQEYTNKRMTEFAENELCINTDKYGHRFELEQEWIGKAGLFVQKKRYGIHIISEEGEDVDDMEIKGLDIVRSSYPELFQDFLEDVLKMILDGKDKEKVDEVFFDFKDKIKNGKYSIQQIATPTGVKGLDKYYSEPPGHIKGTPIHVKSALNYNRWLKRNNLENKYKKIKNNNKIKWLYVNEKNLGVSEIGFPADNLPHELKELIKDNINYDRLFESKLNSKIEMFYEPLDWNEPVRIENTFDSLFE